jgi:uroporphyrinogen-III decarboxylase
MTDHVSGKPQAEALLKEAYRFENKKAPYIIYDVNYWLFGEKPDKIPPGYCSNDPSVMIRYQTEKMERHAALYDDAYIPFLMPWFGTGVLASGFGVEVIFQEGMDPAVNLPTINNVEAMADLKIPDFEKDGIIPMVLNALKAMKTTTSLPVGVTDCQGPLTTALSVIGYDKMIFWMHDYPEKIHALMQLVTDALISWVAFQKELAGQKKEGDAYVLGVKIPEGYGGVWLSDDDCVIFGPELYREFVVSYNAQVLKAFGGGAIHYCGRANQHIDNYLATEGLTAIHNMNLDDLDSAAEMKKALSKKGIPYIAGDFNVKDENIDEYYRELFSKMDPEGLIVVPYIAPAVALDKGKYIGIERDPEELGKKIESAILKYNR